MSSTYGPKTQGIGGARGVCETCVVLPQARSEGMMKTGKLIVMVWASFCWLDCFCRIMVFWITQAPSQFSFSLSLFSHSSWLMYSFSNPYHTNVPKFTKTLEVSMRQNSMETSVFKGTNVRLAQVKSAWYGSCLLVISAQSYRAANNLCIISTIGRVLYQF